MTSTQKSLPVVTRADDVPGPPQGCWTYADYAAIPDDGRRYEIIDGVLYVSPSPVTAHQYAAGRILAFLKLHVEFTGKGAVFGAPFDVELPASRSMVQPDVLVVLKANLAIVTASHVVGAPDLVVEVSSPGTAGYDRRGKQDAYARAGVPEYWIAEPLSRTVEPMLLEGGSYSSLGVFAGSALIPSRVLPDFPVPVDDLFAPREV